MISLLSTSSQASACWSLGSSTLSLWQPAGSDRGQGYGAPATLFAITVPLFVGRTWLAYEDRIGMRLTGMHDDIGAWLAAGQIAFIVFRVFSLLILQAERGQNALREQMERDWLTGALNRAGLDRGVRTIGACIANRFAQTMKQHVPTGIAPSISVGEADAKTPIADLIARADQAMYAVKGDRRKPVAYFKLA